MSEKELRKAYDKEWKEKHSGKYLVWLICYAGSFVPLIAGLMQCIGGMNDDKFVILVVCFALFAALEIVALVLMVQRGKGWKAYRDTHKDRLS